MMMFTFTEDETFWILTGDYDMPENMIAYVDSSYGSGKAHVKKEGHGHHSSGFVFNVSNGKKNYGYTRNEYLFDRISTPANAEFIGINKFLSYVLDSENIPKTIMLYCDNMTIVRILKWSIKCIDLGYDIIETYRHMLHYDDLRDFVELYHKFAQQGVIITLGHVKGHGNNLDNIIADKLANFSKMRRAGASANPAAILISIGSSIKGYLINNPYDTTDIHDYIVAISNVSKLVKGESYYGYALYNVEEDYLVTGTFSPHHKNKSLEALAVIHGLEELENYHSSGEPIGFYLMEIKGEQILHCHFQGFLLAKESAGIDIAKIASEHFVKENEMYVERLDKKSHSSLRREYIIAMEAATEVLLNTSDELFPAKMDVC